MSINLDNFQDSLNPLCSCSLEPESITHYLFHCLFYNGQLKTLLDSLCDIDESISNLSETNLITLLLYGNSNLYSTVLNTKIINCTTPFFFISMRENRLQPHLCLAFSQFQAQYMLSTCLYLSYHHQAFLNHLSRM